VIDASLVPVPIQRHRRAEHATLQAGACPAEWEAQPAKRRQKDTQARWTVKHGGSHYGDKNHVNIDNQHTLIRRYTVTDAAVHDSQVLKDVLLAQPAGRDVWADAAYGSQVIEAQLTRRQLRSRIQDKGYPNTLITAQQKASNQKRSQTRARVEHVFGHHVMAMGGKLLRTIGLVRARAKLGLRNLAYNFHRFLWLIRSAHPQPA